MKRLLVNDCKTTIPGTETFWFDLQEWFDMQFVGGAYPELDANVDAAMETGPASLIIRNASYFPPLTASEEVPTIALLQDILSGAAAALQQRVAASSTVTVFNSRYTAMRYGAASEAPVIIPLPVDFDKFSPGNTLGYQQMIGLPDKCIMWIGAHQGPAGDIKGWPFFLKLARLNPDLNFVAVFKDGLPTYAPANVALYAQVPHERLVELMRACRVGVCTSKQETQHLAGIEMGAVGLPIVAPPVGCYFRVGDDFPGIIEENMSVGAYSVAIRKKIAQPGDPWMNRQYWAGLYDIPVIKRQWQELVKAVEG